MAFVALQEKADRPITVRFLKALIAAVPYRLHTLLTDNGIQIADFQNRDGWTAGPGSIALTRSAEPMASSTV